MKIKTGDKVTTISYRVPDIRQMMNEPMAYKPLITVRENVPADKAGDITYQVNRCRYKQEDLGNAVMGNFRQHFVINISGDVDKEPYVEQAEQHILQVVERMKESFRVGLVNTEAFIKAHRKSGQDNA